MYADTGSARNPVLTKERDGVVLYHCFLPGVGSLWDGARIKLASGSRDLSNPRLDQRQHWGFTLPAVPGAPAHN